MRACVCVSRTTAVLEVALKFLGRGAVVNLANVDRTLVDLASSRNDTTNATNGNGGSDVARRTGSTGRRSRRAIYSFN